MTGILLKIRHVIELRFLLLAALMVAPAWAHATRVTILLSDDSASYREVANVLSNVLASEIKAGLELQVVTLAEPFNFDAGAKQALIVTVGSAAAQRAINLQLHTPILATLIPKRAFEIMAMGSKRKLEQGYLTALYMDQPLDRQIALVKVALPQAQSFGTLLGLHTFGLGGLIVAVAEKFQLSPVLVTIDGEDELFQGLRKVANEVDAVVVVPDNSIINRQTIRNFLLTTYRARIPVFGYAPSQVDAGVLAAVFSTPYQIGQQAGEWVRKIVKNHLASLSPPEYPHYYRVKANYNVARSLNIALPDEEYLARELQKLEDGL